MPDAPTHKVAHVAPSLCPNVLKLRQIGPLLELKLGPSWSQLAREKLGQGGPKLAGVRPNRLRPRTAAKFHPSRLLSCPKLARVLSTAPVSTVPRASSVFRSTPASGQISATSP